MIYVEAGDGVFYAEVEPAGSCWLPLKGRTSRWWFEVHRRPVGDDEFVTTMYAYEDGGSSGAFTFRRCLTLAQVAADKFSSEYWHAAAVAGSERDRQTP